MRYAIYLLLLLGGCKSAQVVTPAIEIQAPDSLPDPVSVNGWVFVRTSVDGGLYVPPSAPKKVKFKNVGNDYSKVKDAGNIDIKDKSTVKDKSKEKPKTKADIIGNDNQLQKSEGVPPLLIYLSIGGVFLGVLLFLGWPKIKRFLFPF